MNKQTNKFKRNERIVRDRDKMDNQSIGTSWDFSLFGCCSAPFISFLSCAFCPCQVARQRATTFKKFGCGDCLFSICCFPCASCINRRRIRQNYDIVGNDIGDCCCTCLCGCCTVVQHARELDLKGDRPGGLFMEKGPKKLHDEETASNTTAHHDE
ncbi:hypothetical protein DFA_04619 [Cavenderia fasciculata]|uniref:PLAC8 family protein n=1 Tax=Cavenderia fasciculata TaxID=261658 RepID=F4PQ28_CACFS|nr:uncharacterized protein DFA_04619 [Cavenderia fasciculata]EGG22491.1 hypothetical protein DFA_04619 [Cavenderia fasciculata]|eukprot:XP_004360342.1 hypothetical protein DFA_04619 [Cavenderia fasciculata]